MMSNKNILTIDNRIRQHFAEEYAKLSAHKKTLTDLGKSLKSLKSKTLSGRLYKKVQDEHNRLTEHIQQVESRAKFNFYIAESVHLVEEYKTMLKIPIKMNFMGKPIKENKVKKKLIKKFFDVACRYIDINKSNDSKKNNIVCGNCHNKKDFDIIDRNTYICMKCFAQQTVMLHNSSYNDIDRVNISSKYMYDRKVHFRDCVKQYQGKQNCTIPSEIYTDLEKQFSLHHLLNGAKDNTSRFNNITKNHILMFLKELGYSNHYENVHLIHYTLTGIKADDISHLEDQLLDDFDALTDLYDRKFKHINRKNFINTQYVLYQLLLRHKHPCKKEEFIILKTIDRKLFHDEVCQELFIHLGWNSTPFY
jgi:hypothetical protein